MRPRFPPLALSVLVLTIGLSGEDRSSPSHSSGVVPPSSERSVVTIPATALPSPTEHILDRDSERVRKEGRREWIEEIHRTAPGTDWRAIERRNGLARMEARNRRVQDERALRVSPWTEIGSRNLAGRMHAAAPSADGDSLYAGSSRGGVWKASLTGQGWRPLSDNLYGGAHGVAVAEGPPETITRITDDGLVHYTENGGANWNLPSGNVDNFNRAIRVLADPSDPDRIYLIGRKLNQFGWNVWRLFLSEDRGLSYTRIRNLGANPGDIWIDRQSGGRIWLLEGPTLLFSDDQGANWTPAGTHAVPDPDNVVLAGSEAGAPTFYAALRNGSQWELHRSTDGGASWGYRYDIHDFWETLEASVVDPDVVLFGGVELWRSADGGGTFSLVNPWSAYYADPVNKLHADLPGLNAVWTGSGSEIHYIATDGGLYRSDDRVASVTNISLEWLGVSQYYSTLTSANDPNLILAGSQDQGYQRSTGPAVGTQRDFEQLISGDYGHLTSGDGTHEWVFSVYPGFVLVQWGEFAHALVAYLDFPGDQDFSWMPYILADPNDPDSFYFCGNQIVYYRKSAFNTTWTMVFGAQDFTVHGGTYTTALAISPVDSDDRITVTNSGVLWYSTDGGTSWTVSADSGPSAHYFYGTALEFSPTVAGEATIGGSGYSGPAVYRTGDGGVTWEPLGDGLPPTLVYDLAYEGGPSAVVYAATEAGPFRLDPSTDAWESLDDATAPLTTYWCVEAVPAAGAMRFGTYGRGIWDYQIQDATSVAELREPGSDEPLSLMNYPNPFRSATTLRFTQARSGDVDVRIYDAAGRLVNVLADGPRPAGRHEVQWNGRDARGRQVAAGVYLARLESPDGVATRRISRLR
jgi:photosystem II stability/assembly factor-like uncharacterized protein